MWDCHLINVFTHRNGILFYSKFLGEYITAQFKKHKLQKVFLVVKGPRRSHRCQKHASKECISKRQ